MCANHKSPQMTLNSENLAHYSNSELCLMLTHKLKRPATGGVVTTYFIADITVLRLININPNAHAQSLKLLRL